jgi:hypothetical protein
VPEDLRPPRPPKTEAQERHETRMALLLIGSALGEKF